MLMALKLAHRASLMVLLICTDKLHCNVDPPEEIKIIDPGHLGRLEITWTLPSGLINTQECAIHYQLEYFNAYTKRWDVIQTPQRTYSAQFDLMKDISVRVYTLLGGCGTNNTWIKSLNYKELVQKPPGTGRHGKAVKDFGCVIYNMEHMICNWNKHPNAPASSQFHMYYWHNELEKTEECPKYLFTNEVKSGCNFTGKHFPDFTDINFCVNGSSSEGPLMPTYACIQIQNYVKLDHADKPVLLTGQLAHINLLWRKPDGRVPEHCLEWEVEHTKEGPHGKNESRISTMHTRLTFPTVGNKERNCFTVRSRVHKYCAERSFWSEWSPYACHSGGSKFDN
ncbi:interleukin-13 receptor subunit alpha-2 isoform X2 [Phycodurus eques]|uniref:interleukin-13 receptor subunit alpha-2 isoform X2 n=1 Tax=Phycodurus eques TaxID=693459 RepID=UPI002ACD2E8D|nr:interleukin-13 receptor subunit alpha-2 isoform X2 [Phycodurus eques]